MDAFLARLDRTVTRVAVLFLGFLFVISVGLSADGSFLGLIKAVAGVVLTFIVFGIVGSFIAWVIGWLVR